MIDYLLKLDEIFFLYLNNINHPRFDQFMYAITSTKTWVPFYIFLSGYIIYTFKKKSWIILITVSIVVGLSDFTASSIFKKTVKRLRPTHEKILEEKVHTVNNYRGGKYSFFSAHASTTFSLSFFLLMLYRKRTKLVYLLPFWALLVSYSRIYLGVHYPLDIIAGLICGLIYATLAYRMPFIKRLTKS